MGKKIIIGIIFVLLSAISITSFAKEEDLTLENKTDIYYDKNRNSKVDIIFYKKVAKLSGNNLGNLKLKKDLTNQEISYINKQNNLKLFKKNDEVSILIGEKEVFKGKIQIDNSYKKLDETTLVQNVWLWNELINTNNALVRPINSNMFNLSFSQGKVLATTDCANFNGEYKVNNSNLEIINLTEVKRFCANKEGDKFIQAIKEVSSFSFKKNGNLIMFLKNNIGSISFNKK